MNENFPLDLFLEKNDLSTKVRISNQSTDEELLAQEILEYIKKSIGSDKYQNYFENNLFVTGITKDCLMLSTSTAFLKNLIQKQYQNIILDAVETAMGKPLHLQIEVKTVQAISIHPSLVNTHQKNVESNNYVMGPKPKSVKDVSFTITDLNENSENLVTQMNSTIYSEIEKNNSTGHAIDPKKVFNNFIVGPSNNLAHASALAVAKSPGEVYQALYIYGNSGLGKTHILHGIANHILASYTKTRLHLTSATELMSEMIHAIQEKTIQQFRKKYYEMIDVLIIDDIHELKNREGTQNEFFHIFNELHRRKKQLIFTSDKDPKEITGIEDRIKTRLSSALVVEIQQPDLETRIAILKKKAFDKDIYLPDDVVNLIASCIKNNIRELEGSLIKLGAYSSIFKVDIDLQTAKEQLKLDDSEQGKSLTIESIAKTVSQYCKVTIPDIRSKTRSKDITVARHLAMYLAYYIGKSTLSDIGNYFGKRDHTSVIHAVNKMKSLQKTDPNISKSLYELEKSL
jgi:chromosomal replication initiator protein